MSRILPAVFNGIFKLMPLYIKFPHEAQRQVEVMQGFSSISNMPGVIGAIDCTHVRIKAPSGDAFAYINRKNFNSVNVQLISDAKCVLSNIVALRNSTVGRCLEDGSARDGWVIGKNITGLYNCMCFLYILSLLHP